MTQNQIKLVKGLLYREGLLSQEKELVMQYTEGRTYDLKNMSYSETNALVHYLGGGTSDARDKMVKKILSMAHELHWEDSSGKIDMDRVNNWCVKYTPFHAPLDEISDSDMPKVVSIFNNVYMSFLKGL